MDARVPRAVLEAAARRAHRAAVARTLEAGLPPERSQGGPAPVRGSERSEPGGTGQPHAAALDWAALDAAPPWLALDAVSLRLMRRRVGSVLLAPALRLWIAAAKVKAARDAVGAAWWWRLLDHRPWPDWSNELAQWGDWPAEDTTSADAVAAVLDDAGTAVLLATLPHGALRHAASEALGSSTTTAPMVMAQAAAQAVLALTVRLLQDEAFAAQAQADASNRTRDDGAVETAGEAPVGAADDAAGDAADRAAASGADDASRDRASGSADSRVASPVDTRRPAQAAR